MVSQWIGRLSQVAMVIALCLILGMPPAFATTLSFKTTGIVKRDGILTGKLVYSDQAPMLVLSGGGLPDFIDFNSCVGRSGDVSSNISQRDSRIAFSTADSLFGKLIKTHQAVCFIERFCRLSLP